MKKEEVNEEDDEFDEQVCSADHPGSPSTCMSNSSSEETDYKLQCQLNKEFSDDQSWH